MRLLVAAANLQRRLLGIGFGILGPTRAYGLMRFLARRFYQAAPQLRDAGEARVRAALRNVAAEHRVRSIAERAFVHRMWNLVDLALAPRMLRPSTYARYGGRMAEEQRAAILDAQHRGQPLLLLTAYYGPYDLLPVFLGLNGIPATAVYRPHPNRAFDRFRQSVRTGTGCRMMSQAGAATKLAELLEEGATVALLADHAAGKTGVSLTFLGQPTTAPRTVGILAERFGAAVGVMVIRRVGEAFRFEIRLADLFGPEAWRDQSDPVDCIVRRYHASLERPILDQPDQYLWLHHRGPRAAGRLAGTPDSEYAFDGAKDETGGGSAEARG